MSNTDYIRIKCVLLGDANVGKTSTVLRFLKNRFTEHSESTIGCAFNNCVLDVEKNKYKIDIWDTAGQERYRGLMPMYYRNADIVFLCVNLSENSVERVIENYKFWKSQIDKHNDYDKRLIFLVGTKSDIKNSHFDSEEKVRSILDENNFNYIETSSKDDPGVKDLFNEAVRGVSQVRNIEENSIIVKKVDTHSSWYTSMSFCNIL